MSQRRSRSPGAARSASPRMTMAFHLATRTGGGPPDSSASDEQMTVHHVIQRPKAPMPWPSPPASISDYSSSAGTGRGASATDTNANSQELFPVGSPVALIPNDPSSTNHSSPSSSSQAQNEQQLEFVRQVRSVAANVVTEAQNRINAAESVTQAAMQNAEQVRTDALIAVRTCQATAENSIGVMRQHAEQRFIEKTLEVEHNAREQARSALGAAVDQVRSEAASVVQSQQMSHNTTVNELTHLIQGLQSQLNQIQQESSRQQVTINEQHNLILSLQTAHSKLHATPVASAEMVGPNYSFSLPPSTSPNGADSWSPIAAATDFNSTSEMADRKMMIDELHGSQGAPQRFGLQNLNAVMEDTCAAARTSTPQREDTCAAARISPPQTPFVAFGEARAVPPSPLQQNSSAAAAKGPSVAPADQRRSNSRSSKSKTSELHRNVPIASSSIPPPNVHTASAISAQCPMCGSTHFVWHDPWKMFICSSCSYPAPQFTQNLPPGPPPVAPTSQVGTSQHVPPVPKLNLAKTGVTHSPGVGAWSGTPPPNQGGAGNSYLRDLDLDGDETGGSSSNHPSSPSSSSSSESSDDHPHGGGGGGHDIDDLLGAGSAPPGMDWTVDETEVYKDKDLLSLKMPDIPHDSAGAQIFWNNAKTQIGAIDRSSNDVLTQWIDLARALLGDHRAVIQMLDSNSQGCVRLDRFLGKLLTEKGENHPIFSVKFASYISLCHAHNRSPKGRVLLAMIAQRFRLDRSRGKAISLLHLYQIPLASFKLSDVIHFTSKVRFVLANLRQGEVIDKALMFDWLFEKFKNWNAISSEVKKIRRSRVGSRRRTWAYLWKSIHEYVEHHYEDANQLALANAIAKTAGVKAVPGKTKTKKKHKDDQEPGVANVPPEPPPSKKGLAAQPKGKGKAKGKGQPPPKGKAGEPTPSDREVAQKTEPSKRTAAHKKFIGCRFFLLGTCTNGDKCSYSHKDADIQRLSKKQAAAAQKIADANAAGAESQPEAEPKAKGKAKAASSKKKASGSVAAAIAAGLTGEAETAAVATAPATPAQSESCITKFVKKGLRVFSRVMAATAPIAVSHIPKMKMPMNQVAPNNGNGVSSISFGTLESKSFLSTDHISVPGDSCCAALPARGILKTQPKQGQPFFYSSEKAPIFPIEYIQDSGAGRPILSVESLTKQNIPKSIVSKFIEPSSEPITFECGGGDIPSNTSIMLTSPLQNKVEAHVLPDSPLAMSMGMTVNDGKPFIWCTGELPWHCTNRSKLKITCPLKFRHYADRVDEFVPIFKEQFTLGARSKATSASNFLNSTAIPAIPDVANDPPDEPADSDADLFGDFKTDDEAEEVCQEVDIDVPMTLPDVPTDGDPDDIVADVTIRTRSMSKRALILEANSIEHKRDHFPHNPYCEICVRAHMRQRSVSRKKEKTDDLLPAIKKVGERLAADHMIIHKSHSDGSTMNVSLAIRDEYSGAGLACPRRTRSKTNNYNDLKFFVGRGGATRPKIMVKSDTANEITGAVRDLGWIPEPSLANRFPHNSSHERWIGTLKSVIRSAVLQAGFFDPIDSWAAPFSSIALTLKQPCPIHPHERDAAGNVLEAFKFKLNWTCYQCHTGGEDFSGKRPMFGQLCFYLNDSSSTLMPRTAPGLFITWKLESGYRYRGALMIADYELLRSGSYKWNQLRTIHEREVYFPEKAIFPFAEAREAALKDMSNADSKLPKVTDLILPFQDEIDANLPTASHGPPELPPIAPKYKLSLNRLVKYGETPGCKGCRSLGTPNLKPHSPECKERFSKIFAKTPAELSVAPESDEPPADTGGGLFTSVESAALRPSQGGDTDEYSMFMSTTHENAPTDAMKLGLEARIAKLSDVAIRQFNEFLSTSIGIAPGDDGHIDIDFNGISVENQIALFNRLDLIEQEQSLFDDDPDAATSPPIVAEPHEGNAEPSMFNMSASAKLAEQLKGRKVIFNMSDYVKSSVEHYKKLAGVDVVREARTPYCPDGSLHPDNDEVKGELSSSSCSILMKVLWAARLARPDLSRACNKLTTKVQNWSSNDDRKLRRLIEYMEKTKNLVLEGFICDPPDKLELWLFVDADLASDPDTSKSSSGAWVVLVGPSSFMPLSWLHTKQTATAKSTTEAEGVAMVYAMLHELYPIWDMIELILGRKVTVRVKEDNTATIKVMRKGYSPKLRHVVRTHKLDLGTVKEAIDDHGVILEHVETKKQCSDIFTKDLPPHQWPKALQLLGMRPMVHEGAAIERPLQESLEQKIADSLEPEDEPSEKARSGGATACAIIDDVVASCNPGEASCPLDDQSVAMTLSSAKVVAAAVSSKIPVRRTRPSGKLPGWGKLIELCTKQDSNLQKSSKDFPNVEVIGITLDHDFSNKETVQQTLDMVETNPGISLHGSLPCTDWTTWQAMCVHLHGPEYLEKLKLRRKASIQMVKDFVRIAERVIELGGEVSFEWPSSCRGWLIPELLAFVSKFNLWGCLVDGCALDMKDKNELPILKRWRFIMTSRRMHSALSKISCKHPKGFRHGVVEREVTAGTAEYPMKLCTAMLASLFGWYECTPAMPCVPVKPQTHREKDVDPIPPAVSSTCPPEDKVSCPVSALVHKLLSWKETRFDPKAVEAVKAEVQALADIGTWDESSVTSRADLIEWAQKNKIKIVVGEGLGICSIKNEELPEDDVRRKYKGRFCYRTPTARDEEGAIAIFQEMASRPTTITSLNIAIAYGILFGHKVTVADAIKAYVQSLLKSKDPTYLEMPKHLVPDKFKHIDRPCFRLVRALYGHPEAGGHWERHLTLIVKALGGRPVNGHPSCFWFPDSKLLLIIYVDDLLLAGPADEHDGFWKKLEKEVNIEPPEELDRYLGRHHSFEEMEPLKLNLIEEFTSPVVV